MRIGGGAISGLSGLSGMAGAAGGRTVRVREEATDTNGTALTAHTVGPTNVPGGGWTCQGGSEQIQSNKIQGSQATTRNVSRKESGSADGLLTCECVDPWGLARWVGLAVRITDKDNCWLVAFKSTSNVFQIVEVNAAVETVRATVAYTPGGTQTIEVELNGSTITARVAGGNEISYASATFNQSVTPHGFVTGQVPATFDNWEFSA